MVKLTNYIALCIFKVKMICVYFALLAEIILRQYAKCQNINNINIYFEIALIHVMNRNSNNNKYQAISKLEDGLSQQIRDLKAISSRINSQLRNEQKTRNGLQQYLDAGIEGLKKTNQILNELLGTKSLFGCNTCILFGIALLVIIILILI